MKFAEHGAFEIKIMDRLLMIDATGPFNSELGVRFQKTLELCVGELEGTNWTQLVILHRDSLFTKNAEDYVVSTLIDRRQRGLTAAAVVLVDMDYPLVVKQQLARCYQLAGVDVEFFTTEDDAKKWLKFRE